MAIKVNDVTETSKYHGRVYYFCSKTCKDTFEKDPSKYAHKDDDIPMHGHNH